MQCMDQVILPSVIGCNDDNDGEPLVHEYTCRICGKHERLVFEHYKTLVSAVLKRTDNICPACYEVKQRERMRIELSKCSDELAIQAGVPDDFLRWDASKGNNNLLRFCFDSLGKWAFIADRVDVGKTRAVCRAIKEAFRRDALLNIRFCNLNRLASDYAAMCGRDYDAANRMIRGLCNADMLVLDDLGKKGRYSDAFGAAVYDVCNALYERGAVLWITANRRFADCSKYFSDDVFEAVYSRFGRQKNAGKYAGWSFGGAE